MAPPKGKLRPEFIKADILVRAAGSNIKIYKIYLSGGPSSFADF